MMANIFVQQMFKGIDPTAAPNSQTVKLNENRNCARHQLHVDYGTTNPAAGTVSVKGISWGTIGLGAYPAKIDSRLDAFLATAGAQVFVFYGLYDALRFEFASFAAGNKVNAWLVSVEGSLKYSGNNP